MSAESQVIPVDMTLGPVTLPGSLGVPDGARGIVVFAHGSGSSRLSPRNTYVADVLRSHRIGTFLFDLLTEEEDAVYETRFNIRLLSERLVDATRWLMRRPEAADLPLGYFGASTGSAAALYAAATLGGDTIKAVVSRGGRPDLALDALPNVQSPTLLIIGGHDLEVIGLNRTAYDFLTAPKRLVTIPGATHLFEEPGALEEVAQVAAEWFTQYLTHRRGMAA